MELKPFCYLPESVDKEVSKLTEKTTADGKTKATMSVQTIRDLRGMYDEAHPDKPLDLSKPQEVLSALKTFRRELYVKDSRESVGIDGTHTGLITKEIDAKNTVKHFKRLKVAFPSAQTRQDRVNMLASFFSEKLDYWTKDPKIPYTRKQLCNGIEVNGKKVAGETAIFESIFQDLFEIYESYNSLVVKANQEGVENKEAAEKAEKYRQILLNYPALVAFARKKLKDTEGLELGSNSSYAKEADENSFGDNDILELWDLSESIREGWQQNSDLMSSFGSVGKEVRRVLSKINKIKDGSTTQEVEKDDLGYHRTLDPVQTHQLLLNLLRGIKNETHMLRRLRQAAINIPQLMPVFEELQKNPQLRTQFFCDFKKNFQRYAEAEEKYEKGVKKIISFIKNKPRNYALENYKARLQFNKQVNSKNSFYDKDGKLIYENMKTWREVVSKQLMPATTEAQNIFSKIYKKSIPFNKMSANEKIKTLQQVLEPLGIEATETVLRRVLADNRQVYKIINTVQDIYKKGFEKNFETAELQKLDKGELTNKNNKTFNQFLQTKYNSSSKRGLVETYVEKILDVIAANNEELMEDSKILSKDKKGNNISRYSSVLPSYLGDQLETIESYVKVNDKEGLKKYLEDKFLSSCFYAKKNPDGTYYIYNKWLEELYKECLDDKTDFNPSGFASNFIYRRFLGFDNVPVEKFTSKQQYICMLSDFNFAENATTPNGEPYAWYPVFVTGDSNCLKSIKAPRYSKETLLDGFWNIYQQEIQRMQLVRDTNTAMSAKGLSLIPNFNATENLFVALPFLNEDFEMTTIDKQGRVQKVKGKYFNMLKSASSSQGNISSPLDIATEESVKAAIEEYMKDYLPNFKKSLQKVGLLNSEVKLLNDKITQIKRYPELDQFISTEGKHFNHEDNTTLTTDEALDDFLLDYLYNHMFATQQQFQYFTVDTSFYGIAEVNTSKGKKVIGRTKDLQKRYKETHAPGNVLSVEAVDFDGNLYCGIDEQTGQPQTWETCVYFDDIEVNSETTNTGFFNAIKNFFKEGSSIPKKYKENTLTDGQGYRTLEGYRKVMGMSGKWSKEMEDTYNELQNYREQLRQLNANKANEPNYEQKKLEIIDKIQELNVVFQPIKPYMYTLENYTLPDGRILKVPVQHKYAEVILIPELLPEDSKLRHLAEWMEERHVDMAGSTKIVKVGAFGSANISSCKNKDELYAALDGQVENGVKTGGAYIHKLSYEDYRIQTNVPEHVNSSQLLGTQLKKLLFKRLDLDRTKDYSHYVGLPPQSTINLGGNTSATQLDNGRKILAFYNSLLMANILDANDKFLENMNNVEAVSALLVQSTINNSRESLDNLNAFTLEDGKFALPLFEGTVEHDAMALMLSQFKKLVNKQMIRGGSAVQASCMGLKGYEEDGGLKFQVDPKNPNNILYAEVEMPFDLSYTVNGREVKLKFSDYCNFDGTLKVEEVGTDDTQYLSWKGADGKYHRPLIERDFPGILSRVAYRIPTESDYSAINIKVVRFSPKILGGTIKVPPEGTTIAGFDFDIDKLFFIMKDFKKTRVIKNKTLTLTQETERESYVKSIWEDIYARPYKGSSAFTIRDILKGLQDKAMEDFYRKRDKQFPKSQMPDEKKEPEKFQAYMKKVADWSNENRPPKELYRYWSQANLPGTYQEAFNDYLEQYPEEKENLAKFQMYVEETLEEYDFSKSPLENSVTARNNMLLTIMQKRLEDESTFQRRYTPGGFPKATNASRFLKQLLFGNPAEFVKDGKVDTKKLEKLSEDKNKDPEPEFDPVAPETIVTYFQQNQVADAAIGIFANQNTHHALVTLLNKFEFKTPIAFAGHKYKDLLKPSNSENVDGLVTESLSSSVDAVKTPVLKFLNLNTMTSDAGACLLRLGYTYEELGCLLQQPIIVELCDYCANNNVRVELGISHLMDKYTNHGQIKVEPATDEKLSFETLATNILKYRLASEGLKMDGTPAEKITNLLDNNDFKIGQIQILHLFNHILQDANLVTASVTNTKFTASNAVGSTSGDMYAQQSKVDKYNAESENAENPELICEIVSPIKGALLGDERKNIIIDNDEKNLEMEKQAYMDKYKFHPFAYEQAAYDANRKALQVISKYTPYETALYKGVRNRMATLTRSQALSADEINRIHSDLLVALLSNQSHSDFDGEDFIKNHSGYEDKTNREFYREEFVSYLYDKLEKNPKLKELQIFQKLAYSPKEVYVKENGKIVKNELTGLAETKQMLEMRLMHLGGMQSYQKDEIVESWEELYNTDPQLAKDLFLFNYYKIGFGFSPLAFMNLAPVSLKQQLDCGTDISGNRRSYLQFLQEIQNEDNLSYLNIDSFAVQHILNHTDDYNYVYRVPKNLQDLCDYKKSNGTLEESFTINVSKNNSLNAFRLADTSLPQGEAFAFVPIIQIGQQLYKADGDIAFNISSTNSITYVKCDKQGVKNKELSYTASMNATPQSIEIDDEGESRMDKGDEQITPEGIVVPETYDREKYMEALIKDYEQALDNMYGVNEVILDEDGNPITMNDRKRMLEGFKEILKNANEENIKGTVEMLRQACRDSKTGILLLGADGQPQIGC